MLPEFVHTDLSGLSLRNLKLDNNLKGAECPQITSLMFLSFFS